jgi:hypothetical protein
MSTTVHRLAREQNALNLESRTIRRRAATTWSCRSGPTRLHTHLLYAAPTTKRQLVEE